MDVTTMKPEWVEWRWRIVPCSSCRGTGVRYCCDNRNAEMTCDQCHGFGRNRELVQAPKKETTS